MLVIQRIIKDKIIDQKVTYKTKRVKKKILTILHYMILNDPKSIFYAKHY
jgi:hypothetical protein